LYLFKDKSGNSECFSIVSDITDKAFRVSIKHISGF
jgi:hypothetical protein